MFALNSKFHFLICSGLLLGAGCGGSSICDTGACDGLTDADASVSSTASSVDLDSGSGGASNTDASSGSGGNPSKGGSGGSSALVDAGGGSGGFDSGPADAMAADAGPSSLDAGDAAASDAAASDAAADAGDGSTGGPTPQKCTADIQCDMPTPVCSTTLGQCVPCLQDDDCHEPGLSQCVGTFENEKRCAECDANDQCPDGVCFNDQCMPCVVDPSLQQNNGCSAELPKCLDGDPENLADNTCVECLDDNDCSDGICLNNACVACNPEDNRGCEAPTDLCRPGASATENTCVSCLSNDECSTPEAPHCFEGTDLDGMCGDCQSNDDCTSFSGLPECSPTGECVECYENAQCPDPNASRCGAGNECTTCEINADCSHLTGRNVCDSGQCVECTVSDESACGANSCDPAENTCTNTARGSVGLCETCLADSECTTAATTRCVPMQFGGSPRRSSYCMRASSANCVAPYTVLFTADSLSGVQSQEYCGINQDTVSCEAVKALIAGDNCTSDGECGPGSKCNTVGGVANQCTYTCSNALQCPGLACDPVDADYCH